VAGSKVTVRVDTSLRLLNEGVAIKPITPDIAALATQFPADRLIGATARAEGIPLITRDENIRREQIAKNRLVMLRLPSELR